MGALKKRSVDELEMIEMVSFSSFGRRSDCHSRTNYPDLFYTFFKTDFIISERSVINHHTGLLINVFVASKTGKQKLGVFRGATSFYRTELRIIATWLVVQYYLTTGR